MYYYKIALYGLCWVSKCHKLLVKASNSRKNLPTLCYESFCDTTKGLHHFYINFKLIYFFMKDMCSQVMKMVLFGKIPRLQQEFCRLLFSIGKIKKCPVKLKKK